MPNSQEKLIQAAKAYKTCRVLEAKSLGGRALDESADMMAKANSVRELSGRMSAHEQEALTEMFIGTLQADADLDLARALENI